MRVRFYLKRPGAEKETAIFATVSYNGKSFKVYTTESIKPKFWNEKTQAAKNSPGFPESPEFNLRLTKLKSLINSLFIKYRNDHNNSAPSHENFKAFINSALKRGSERSDFIGYYENFIDRSKNNLRLSRKGKAVGAGVTRGHSTTLMHLKNFIKNKPLYFEDIDLDFHQDYMEYLQSNPISLSLNTIGSHFRRIITVMNDATERGINTSVAYKSKRFIKPVEEASTIALTADEIKAIQKLDFNNSPRLDNVRDLFVIGCHTGFRYGDLISFNPQKHIHEGRIRITQSKTQNVASAPVHSVVKAILEKRNGAMPAIISNQRFNDYLKEIGQMVPELKAPVDKTITKGSKLTKVYEKWELLSAHTSRRSFCTNEYRAGTPVYAIMAMSGHKTEREFLKYIKVTVDEHIGVVEKLWEQRENRLKAV